MDSRAGSRAARLGALLLLTAAENGLPQSADQSAAFVKKLVEAINSKSRRLHDTHSHRRDH
jgi:hypothetical protein